MNEFRNKELSRRLLRMILADPEVSRFLDARTQAFLERPKHWDRPDPLWTECHRTVLNLLLLDLTLSEP
jgi:hypothetical protein